jgi:hypothetical protein
MSGPALVKNATAGPAQAAATAGELSTCAARRLAVRLRCLPAQCGISAGILRRRSAIGLATGPGCRHRHDRRDGARGQSRSVSLLRQMRGRDDASERPRPFPRRRPGPNLPLLQLQSRRFRRQVARCQFAPPTLVQVSASEQCRRRADHLIFWPHSNCCGAWAASTAARTEQF